MIAKYSSIVVAVDFSEDGNQVLEAVPDLKDREPGEYSIISVVAPLITSVSGMDPSAFAASYSISEIEAEITQQASRNVRELASSCGLSQDRVQILHGNPSTVIRSFAEENGADLIIIGSHARKGVARFVLGSTATAVLHGATCDVLTIRVT